MDDKKQDFKQNLKSYVSDEEIVHDDSYFEVKSENDAEIMLMLIRFWMKNNQKKTCLKRLTKNTLKKSARKITRNTKTTSKTIHLIGI
ncbi:hypothetical protein [Finegoldia magna]|uniref:hypothetical protein n=1 Tax=Finegoldia magna TaxID=1260 RepID=UPI0028040634|nr:hypothetical protein [Finegoldia magna]MDU1399962.1 hypothetical protein [Finegoldia magna]